MHLLTPEELLFVPIVPMRSVPTAKLWTSHGKAYTPTKDGGRLETPKIPITNVLLKLLVWAVKPALAKTTERCDTIPPKAGAIQATREKYVPSATKAII